ncbi:MAG: 3-dehydroquinate synthase [Chloroflexi bacterium]|nr:3-dehydroquinate synthase [Chloroflexota bacterium]
MSSPTSSAAEADAPRPAMRPVPIRAGTSSYDALVGPDAVRELGSGMEQAGLKGRTRIVADAVVWKRHGAAVEAALAATGRGFQTLTISGGEAEKTLAGAERVYDWLLDVGTDRGDHLIAVGGGVVGDLAGFVAASFLRGIPVVQAPTSLLAMVDSSIGGKVGVNHRLGKNLIGAFHQPALVVADTRFLETLPEREYRNGWAEIVKAGTIVDSDLFATLEANAGRLLRFEDPILLGDVIRRAIELKGQVVGADEREAGLRIILNYGHTIGHAIEAATGYHRYLHGEAVAIGMAGAGFIANRRGMFPDECLARQAALLAQFGLPKHAECVAAADLLGPLSRDKKARGSTIQWVLANGIGSVTTARDVTPDEVAAALAFVGCT